MYPEQYLSSFSLSRSLSLSLSLSFSLSLPRCLSLPVSLSLPLSLLIPASPFSLLLGLLCNCNNNCVLRHDLRLLRSDTRRTYMHFLQICRTNPDSSPTTGPREHYSLRLETGEYSLTSAQQKLDQADRLRLQLLCGRVRVHLHPVTLLPLARGPSWGGLRIACGHVVFRMHPR